MSDPIEHGPETVGYSLTQDGAYDPFLQCLCGWSISECDWENVGIEFDIHLEASKEE